MREVVRRAGAALAAVLVVALAGCASIPTSGGVNAGVAREAEQSLDVEVLVRGPQGGETQQEILDGFLEAAANPSGNYEVAREFLAPSFEWAADAGAIIDVLDDRTFGQLGETTIRL